MSDHIAPELYGLCVAPCVKWSCGVCRRRNDHKCVANPAPKEIFVCRFCKRATTIEFARKEAAA